MKRTGLFLTSFLSAAFMLIQVCLGGQYDLKQITPQVDRALKNRSARYLQLQDMKQKGLIGENNTGYTANLAGQATAEDIVQAENADRKVIYQALVEQNSLGPDGMREVQRAFAEVQSEKASPGEMIQSASGKWGKKS